jgi:hypothetical protein
MVVQTPLRLHVAPNGQSLSLLQPKVLQSASELQITPTGTLQDTRPEEELGQSLFFVQLICEQKPFAQLTPVQSLVLSGRVTQQSSVVVHAFPPTTEPPTRFAALASQIG